MWEMTMGVGVYVYLSFRPNVLNGRDDKSDV